MPHGNRRRLGAHVPPQTPFWSSTTSSIRSCSFACPSARAPGSSSAKSNGGFKHGLIAYDATLGLEIQSDSDALVKSIYKDIRDIVEGATHQYGVDLKINTISNVGAANLKFNHPLVKSAGEIIRRLGLKPTSAHSESELSIFLARNISGRHPGHHPG